MRSQRLSLRGKLAWVLLAGALVARGPKGEGSAPASAPEEGSAAAVNHPGGNSMGTAGFVDIHYDNRERSRFTIVASRYSVSMALDHPRVTALRLGDETAPNLLEGDGIAFEARRRGGAVYSSERASKPARLNVWRHGPYYHEVHVLDAPLTSLGGRDLPGTMEWIFHCYPEKFHLQAIFSA
jgi:hypothetical protein